MITFIILSLLVVGSLISIFIINWGFPLVVFCLGILLMVLLISDFFEENIK